MSDNPLKRFYAKQMKADVQPRRRKNDRPEHNLTVVPCMMWLAEQKFSMNRIEAKAVFNPFAGRYLSGQTEPGVADAFGCAPDGTGCFIEFKAPGKLSTLKDHQRDWLIQKIERGAFAVVTDSVLDLEHKWTIFCVMRVENAHRDWLKSRLPKPRQSRQLSVEPDVEF